MSHPKIFHGFLKRWSPGYILLKWMVWLLDQVRWAFSRSFDISLTSITIGVSHNIGVVHKWHQTLTGDGFTRFVTRGRGEPVVLWCHTSRFDMHASCSHTRKERCGGQYVSILFTIVFCCNHRGNFCRYYQWVNCFYSIFLIAISCKSNNDWLTD